jgi:ribosomal protein S18 acetylase RimI-like enzyme
MIRKAEFKDLEYVTKIYEDIILHEEQNTKYTAFRLNVYPTKTTAEKALNDNALYVYETGGEVCACIIINQNQPDEYKTIDWRYKSPSNEVVVIHLLCVSPDKSGAGIGKKMVAFAVDEGRQRNCSTIRLDTGGQNTPARYLYEKMGFTIAGTNNMSIGGVIQHNNHLFYEKKITGCRKILYLVNMPDSHPTSYSIRDLVPQRLPPG